jgi:hypothetical protein
VSRRPSRQAAAAPRPDTSNLNIERRDQTVANLALLPLGQDGSTELYTQSGTHLIVDLNGYVI